MSEEVGGHSSADGVPGDVPDTWDGRLSNYFLDNLDGLSGINMSKNWSIVRKSCPSVFGYCCPDSANTAEDFSLGLTNALSPDGSAIPFVLPGSESDGDCGRDGAEDYLGMPPRIGCIPVCLPVDLEGGQLVVDSEEP